LPAPASSTYERIHLMSSGICSSATRLERPAASSSSWPDLQPSRRKITYRPIESSFVVGEQEERTPEPPHTPSGGPPILRRRALPTPWLRLPERRTAPRPSAASTL